MEFDLVNGRNNLGTLIRKQLLQVLDSEVGNANVLDAARSWELLHLSPSITEIPVRVMLLEILWVG